MEILIKNDRTIAELQSDFQLIFPYLKLGFYATQHKPGIAPKKLSPDLLISQCRKKDNEGVVGIKPTDTVKSLEDQFWKTYGLYVQVFRKSGNLWIETSLTDSWSLFQQNLEGEQLSVPLTNTANEMDMTDKDQCE